MSEHNDATEQHIDSNLHTTIRCPFTCSGIKLCKKKNRRLYPMPLGVNWQSILQVNTLNFGFVFTVQQSSTNDSFRFKTKLVYKNHYFANTSSCVPSVVTCIYNRQIYSKIFFFFWKKECTNATSWCYYSVSECQHGRWGLCMIFFISTHRYFYLGS